MWALVIIGGALGRQLPEGWWIVGPVLVGAGLAFVPYPPKAERWERDR